MALRQLHLFGHQPAFWPDKEHYSERLCRRPVHPRLQSSANREGGQRLTQRSTMFLFPGDKGQRAAWNIVKGMHERADGGQDGKTRAPALYGGLLNDALPASYLGWASILQPRHRTAAEDGREGGDAQFRSLFQNPLKARRFEQALAEQDAHRRFRLASISLQQPHLHTGATAFYHLGQHLVAAIVQQRQWLAHDQMQHIPYLVGQFLRQRQRLFSLQQFRCYKKTMHLFFRLPHHQRHPIVDHGAVDQFKTGGKQVLLGIETARLDDAAGDEQAAGDNDLRDLRGHATDDVGEDVDQHKIELPLQARCLLLIERSQLHAHAVAQLVDCHICAGALYRDAAVIDAVDAARAKLRGGEGQNARTGTDIEDAHTGPREAFNLFQAEPRGGMQTRAKGHTGVERQHHLLIRRRIFAPRWADDQPSADMCDVEKLLPGIGPVLFVQRARLQLAHEMWPQASQMPQALGHALPCLLLGSIQRYVSVHIHRLAREHAIFLPLVQQLNRLLNRHPARRVAAQ